MGFLTRAIAGLPYARPGSCAKTACKSGWAQYVTAQKLARLQVFRVYEFPICASLRLYLFSRTVSVSFGRPGKVRPARDADMWPRGGRISRGARECAAPRGAARFLSPGLAFGVNQHEPPNFNLPRACKPAPTRGYRDRPPAAGERCQGHVAAGPQTPDPQP